MRRTIIIAVIAALLVPAVVFAGRNPKPWIPPGYTQHFDRGPIHGDVQVRLNGAPEQCDCPEPPPGTPNYLPPQLAYSYAVRGQREPAWEPDAGSWIDIQNASSRTVSICVIPDDRFRGTYRVGSVQVSYCGRNFQSLGYSWSPKLNRRGWRGSIGNIRDVCNLHVVVNYTDMNNRPAGSWCGCYQVNGE